MKHGQDKKWESFEAINYDDELRLEKYFMNILK